MQREIKRLLNQLYYFLIYSNILIALAAVAQCALSYLILSLPIDVHIILIDGCSTLLLYNFSLLLSKPQHPDQSPYERTRWVFSHVTFLWINTLLALFILLYLILQIRMETLFFLGFIALLSLLYAMPLFRWNGRRGGFRQVPFLKVFHIAVIWSLSTVGLPVVEAWASGAAINWFEANYLGIVKILFLLILTLPFDIRDIKQDSYYHLKTIPNLLGRKKSIQLCYSMLILHAIVILISLYSWEVKAGLLLTNIMVALLFRFVVFARPNFHHVYLLDMGLIVQLVLVWTMLFIF